MLPLALPLEDRIVACGILILNPEREPQRPTAATAALFRIVRERLTGSGFSEEDDVPRAVRREPALGTPA